MKGRTASAAAVEPDPATMHFGDLLYDGESDSGTRPPILRWPEALECFEYLLVMFRVDSASGVSYGDVTDIVLFEYRYCNARFVAGSHVVDRVSNQV